MSGELVEPATPTAISLFTGAGGLDLGIEEAGFVTIAANELEAYACETLKANQLISVLDGAGFDAWFKAQLSSQRCYTKAPQDEIEQLRERIRPRHGTRAPLQHASIIPGDIRGIKSETFIEQCGMKRGELTLIAGGPPCQPFSRAGKRQSMEVDDGRLFMEFVRLVIDLRPRWFLFENVRGLALTKTNVVYARCGCGRHFVVPFDCREAFLSQDAALTQCVCGRTCSAFDVEVVAGGSLDIIVNEFERIGYRCYVNSLNAANFGAPQIRERVFIVGSRDGELFKWPKDTHARPPDRDVGGQQPCLFGEAETRLPEWRSVLNSLWKDGHPLFGRLDPKRAVLWVKNVVRPHDEPVTWSLCRPSPTIGAHQSAKLAIAPDGVPEEQLKRQQWHTMGCRQGDLPPVPVKHAYLSDLDLLRLQTFPTNWYLYGTRMQRAFQIGNAVPPVLARAVGSAVMQAMGLNATLRPIGACVDDNDYAARV